MQSVSSDYFDYYFGWENSREEGVFAELPEGQYQPAGFSTASRGQARPAGGRGLVPHRGFFRPPGMAGLAWAGGPRTSRGRPRAGFSSNGCLLPGPPAGLGGTGGPAKRAGGFPLLQWFLASPLRWLPPRVSAPPPSRPPLRPAGRAAPSGRHVCGRGPVG